MFQLIKAGFAKVASARALGRAALLSVLASLALAAPAGAVTIGSNLSANAGSFPLDGLWVPSGTDAYVIPSSGMLTRWRVKEFNSSDVTGQTVKLEVLTGATATAVDSETLPSAPGFSQNVFEFTVNIPVQAGQHLGLVPGPFSDFAFSGPSLAYDYWATPLTLNETRAPDNTAISQKELLINADINESSSSGGGSSGGGGGNSSGQNGRVVFGNGAPSPTVLTDNPSLFTDPAICKLPPGSPFTCSGAVVFMGLSTGGASHRPWQALAKKKSIVFGRASFQIAPGKTAKIKVKLKKVARGMLSSNHKLKGTLTTTSTLTDGTKSSVSQRLTVKLKPKHH